MKIFIKLLSISLVFAAGCSSYETNEPEEPSLSELTAQVSDNKDTIDSQDKQLAGLREELRHESADINVNSSQARRLYIGPRLKSPY